MKRFQSTDTASHPAMSQESRYLNFYAAPEGVAGKAMLFSWKSRLRRRLLLLGELDLGPRQAEPVLFWRMGSCIARKSGAKRQSSTTSPRKREMVRIATFVALRRSTRRATETLTTTLRDV